MARTASSSGMRMISPPGRRCSGRRSVWSATAGCSLTERSVRETGSPICLRPGFNRCLCSAWAEAAGRSKTRASTTANQGKVSSTSATIPTAFCSAGCLPCWQSLWAGFTAFGIFTRHTSGAHGGPSRTAAVAFAGPRRRTQFQPTICHPNAPDPSNWFPSRALPPLTRRSSVGDIGPLSLSFPKTPAYPWFRPQPVRSLWRIPKPPGRPQLRGKRCPADTILTFRGQMTADGRSHVHAAFAKLAATVKQNLARGGGSEFRCLIRSQWPEESTRPWHAESESHYPAKASTCCAATAQPQQMGWRSDRITSAIGLCQRGNCGDAASGA